MSLLVTPRMALLTGALAVVRTMSPRSSSVSLSIFMSVVVHKKDHVGVVLVGHQNLEIVDDGGGNGCGFGVTQSRQTRDRGFDVGGPRRSVSYLDKRSVRLGEEAFDRQRSDGRAMPVVFEHLGVDR